MIQIKRFTQKRALPKDADWFLKLTVNRRQLAWGVTVVKHRVAGSWLRCAEVDSSLSEQSFIIKN